MSTIQFHKDIPNSYEDFSSIAQELLKLSEIVC